MTPLSDTSDLLVIDANGARHASYRSLLSDLAGEVVTVNPAEAHQAILARRYACLLVNLEGVPGGAAEVLLVGAAGSTSPAPIMLIAPDPVPYRALFAQGPGTFDFLPAPLLPELLRSKVSLLTELARGRERLQHGEAMLGAARRQVSEHVHRTKNLLAIMQSIAFRTLVEGREMAAARDALVGRLRALSRAYQIVVAGDGAGVDLADIVESQLGSVSHRVRASGPPIRVSGSVAHTVALAIHELADNAQRHGALRSPDGGASVGWTYFERGPERYLEIDWTEHGGMSFTAAPQYGFGLALVASLAGSTPSPSVRFDEGSLSCRMRLAHDALILA